MAREGTRASRLQIDALAIASAAHNKQASFFCLDQRQNEEQASISVMISIHQKTSSADFWTSIEFH